MAKLLNEEIGNQVREVLNSMTDPVDVLFFGSETTACEYCEDTQNLLQEVADLSEKVTLHVHDVEKDSALAAQYGVDKVPSFVMARRENGAPVDYGIRFAGIPAGHEFTSLINDLLMVSNGNSNLAPETRAFLASLTQPVNLQVYVTPT